MRCRLTVWSISALAVVGAISACGGSSGNGVASKSPGAIVAAARSAADGVKSLHVAGSVESGGSPITLDLNLVANQGGRGRMSVNGLGFQIADLDQTVYINGSPAFWRHFGGTPAVQLLQGKWLKSPQSGNFASFAGLTDLHKVLNSLLTGHGTLTKGATSTRDGQPVVAVNDTTKGGTLYVATTGKPYAIEVMKTGSQGGRIVFDRFNATVSLTVPPHAIDISQLKLK